MKLLTTRHYSKGKAFASALVLAAAFISTALLTSTASAQSQSASSAAGKTAAAALCAADASIKGESQRTLLGVGYEAMQQGNLDCADRLLSQAYNLDARDPWALLNIGVLRQRQGQLDAARIAYHMAAAFDPISNGNIMARASLSPQTPELALQATSDKATNRNPGAIALANLSQIR
jgi:Flp pilus assembly protein TadD